MCHGPAVSQKEFDNFLHGRLGIRSADGFVRAVLVAGETRDRRPLGVRTLEFTKWWVNERGIHNADESLIDAARYMSQLREYESRAREAGVLFASARIQKKRYLERTRWNPTQRDSDGLRDAINRKSKREII